MNKLISLSIALIFSASAIAGEEFTTHDSSISIQKQLDNEKSKQTDLLYKYTDRPINIFMYSLKLDKIPNDVKHFNEIINKEGNVYQALSKEGNIVDANIISMPLAYPDKSNPKFYSVIKQHRFLSGRTINTSGERINQYDMVESGFSFSLSLNKIYKNNVSVSLTLNKKDVIIKPSSDNEYETPVVNVKAISTDVVISDNKFTVVSIVNSTENDKNVFDFIVIENDK